jgi:predicted transposase YdaD
LLRGREEGREEGRVEGREEGREEGQLAERRAALLEILAVRFGPVPTDIVEQLNQVTDLARLRSLGPVAATVVTVNDFARHLEEPSH